MLLLPSLVNDMMVGIRMILRKGSFVVIGALLANAEQTDESDTVPPDDNEFVGEYFVAFLDNERE